MQIILRTYSLSSIKITEPGDCTLGIGLLYNIFMVEKSRIPPAQRQVQDFPILHIGDIPKFDARTWDFQVEGLITNPLRLNWDEFRKLPISLTISDFHCVTGWTRLDNRWEGVLFRDVIRLCNPKPEAHAVSVLCDGGYYTSLPLSNLMQDDVILAYRWNGQYMEPPHGQPLRLIVPPKYAYKSAKWIRKFRFTKTQEIGYWEARGYSNTADPWTEDRYGLQT
ncbi:MAG: oxidoreductase, molybdopterin binding protein [Dehalococcoidia bacterium]|nr:oxidoreductase, molybdopterin binding protein [Dehalococcoidia bacterium]